MTYTHFFQWNIPKDNHYLGRTDWYINVIAEWNDTAYYSDGKPMVSVQPIAIGFVDLRQVKNWELASRQIVEIAEKHFIEIAKTTRLNKAREVLLKEGESGNPILDRYEVDLLAQEILT